MERESHIASSYAALRAENNTKEITRRKKFVFYGILNAVMGHY